MSLPAPLRLGLPKGSLESPTIELFGKAGWRISTSGRSYFPSIDDPTIRCSFMRPQEMSRYIEAGALDAGVTGQDWVVENESDVHVVCNLVYSKVSLQGTRWVLVVRDDSPVKRAEDLRGKIVATELVKVTQRFFAGRGIDVDVEFSWGATEAKVAEGLVDAIVDVTETGSSLRANKLRVIDTLLTSTTRLIANRDAWRDPAKRNKIEDLALLLRGAIAAREKVGLKMNVPKSKLADILRLLPAEKSPTVNQLADNEWVAVEVIVEEHVERDLVPRLCRAGATGIISYGLKKVIS